MHHVITNYFLKTYLILKDTPIGTPKAIVALSVVSGDTFLSNPYSARRPNVPPLLL